MRAPLVAGAAVSLLCAALLTGCTINPQNIQIPSGISVPKPNPSPVKLQPVHIDPTPPKHLPVPAHSPLPTPTPANTMPPTPTPTPTPIPEPYYPNPLVLPTCATITAPPDVTTPFVVTTGMDRVVPGDPYSYGIGILSLQDLVAARGGITCVWIDDQSKRLVNITDTIIPSSDRASIAATLTGAGWTHWEASEQFWISPLHPDGNASQMCAWPLDEAAQSLDYWICIRDELGQSFGASVQEAEDAFLTVNPRVFH